MVVEAGERYRAGWFARLFLGWQWRDLWTTPIEVPVLDLATFDGGLTPDREGGGLQTKSLHFKGATGRHWAFRSVDKDPTRVLEPEVRESLLGALAQDLTSSENPAGALITASLLETAGVFHSTPALYVMPNDPRLGEFQSSFAGMLGLLELRDEKHLPGVDKVLTSYELFERFEARTDEQVDARDYLRERLIDVFVGDWDRHVDQFRWVRVKEEGARKWRVVPRDRDAALSRFSGMLPSLAAYYTKQLAGFGDNYPSIEKLTFAGRFTDRRLLVSLEKPQWDAVAAELLTKLTDSAIDEAVRQMPKEYYAKAGQTITRALRARRDKLSEAANDFYRVLAQDVDVHGTQGADDVEVVRNADGSVAVTLYSRDERTGEKLGQPFFHRTFKADETDEIRLYLLGGADRVVLQGPGQKSILVRIITSAEAQITDQSRCGGCTEIRREIKPAAVAAATPKDAEPSRDELQARYEPIRDWGWDLLFFPRLSYDSTRGLVFGASGTLTRYGFELDPFSDQTSLGAAYSTGTSQPRIDLATKFRTRSPLSILGFVTYSGMDQANFFGFGNESPRDPTLSSRGFYEVRQKKLTVRPLLDVELVGPLHGRVGGLFEYASNVEGTPVVGGRPGFGATSAIAAEAGLELDATQSTGVTNRGFKASLIGRYYPAVFSLGSDFWKMRGSAAYFLSFHVVTDILFAVHVAGEKNWGSYPWFEAAFLGGIPAVAGFDPGTLTGNLLRGYDLNRYAGDASVVGNAELRIALGSFNTILPMRYGVIGITDVGRVFYAPESSRAWHSSGGGGAWITILLAVPGVRLSTTLTGVVVASGQGTSFSLYSGFGF